MLKSFNKVQIATIFSAHLVHDIYSSFLAPILPLLIEKLNISLSMAAFLDIVRRIPALFNPFLGLLAERTDVRYFVILSPAITATAMSLLGLADSYAILLILLFVAGISATTFHIPTPGIIKEASGSRVGLGMSWFMAGGESARAIGPLIITAAVTYWGLEGTWRLIPFGLIASVILYWRLRHFKTTHTFSKKSERGNISKIVHQNAALFLAISGYMFFQYGMKIAVTLYLPVYLTQNGFSLWHANISLSVLQFFGVIGTFLSGTISDRIGRKKTLFVSGIGAALSMTMFTFCSQPVTMFLTLALLGLFIFATGPVLLALVHDIKTTMPTFINSIYMGISFGISSIVVFLIGVMGDTIGLASTYKIAAALSFCALLFVWFIPKPLKISSQSDKI